MIIAFRGAASKQTRPWPYKSPKYTAQDASPRLRSLDRWKTIANQTSTTGARDTFLEVTNSCACGLVQVSQQPQSRSFPRLPSTTTHLSCTNSRTLLFTRSWLRDFIHVSRRLGPSRCPAYEWTDTNSTDDGHCKVGSRTHIRVV